MRDQLRRQTLRDEAIPSQPFSEEVNVNTQAYAGIRENFAKILKRIDCSEKRWKTLKYGVK